MKHSIFALAGLALLGLASCDKGFELDSELIPQEESKAATGDKVYISSGLVPLNRLNMATVQTPSRFKDTQTAMIVAHVAEPATEDIEVTLSLSLSEDVRAKVQEAHGTTAKYPFAPEGLLKLSKTMLTIKKGALKSEDVAELLFDNIDLFRKFNEDDDFFAAVKIDKVSKGKISSNYGEAYALVNRKERTFKPFDRWADADGWTQIPWSEITLSANRQSAGANPQNVTDMDNTTVWSLDSYDKSDPNSQTYQDAWYQFNFSSPKNLKGYTLQMVEPRPNQMRDYDLMLSRDGGKTWVTYSRAINKETMNKIVGGQRRAVYRYNKQVTEFEEPFNGINAVRLRCEPTRGNGLYYLAGIQFYQE